MFELLENLRAKPEGARKRVAFLTALTVAVALLAVWGTVILPDFNSDRQVQAKADAVAPSPLSTFASTMGDSFASLGRQFGELKDTVTSSLAPAAVYMSATSTTGISTSTETQ